MKFMIISHPQVPCQLPPFKSGHTISIHFCQCSGSGPFQILPDPCRLVCESCHQPKLLKRSSSSRQLGTSSLAQSTGIHGSSILDGFFESLIRGFGRLHSPSGKSQTRGHSAQSRITVLSLSCPIVAKTIDCRPARILLKKVLWLSAPTIRSSAQQCFSSTCHWPQTSDTSGLPSVTTLVETWKATFVPRTCSTVQISMAPGNL